MSDVTIFAPSPVLTVTVEDHPQGAEIHVHAGGQGVWQARMLRRLGAEVTMCCVLTGEIGTTMRHLLEDEGVRVAAVERPGRGAAYLHDRRDGQRIVVAEEQGDPLGRHELDDLYGTMLREGADSRVVILSGPAGDRIVPPDIYRRLAADLREEGRTVMADLAGERMRAAVEGGLDVLKISHEELLDDGLIEEASVPALTQAMRMLRADGARTVIVTRSSDPLLLLDDSGLSVVSSPPLTEAETRGAGDSLTAGVAAGIARGEDIALAITLGAAAGALNVTRHGLGTGDAETIDGLREKVEVRRRPVDPGGGGADGDGRVSPDGLAALASERAPETDTDAEEA